MWEGVSACTYIQTNICNYVCVCGPVAVNVRYSAAWAAEGVSGEWREERGNIRGEGKRVAS